MTKSINLSINTSTGIPDLNTVATDGGSDNKTFAQQNAVLTTMIACIVSGITIICSILGIGVWCRKKNMKSSIANENKLNKIQMVNNKDTNNPLENKIDFPHGAVNLRSATLTEAGENDSVSGSSNLETNKNETIGEQGVDGIHMSQSKSNESLYGEVVHATKDGIAIELQPTSTFDDDWHNDNVQMNHVIQVASRSLSKNQEGDKSDSILEDKNEDIKNDANEENATVLYDQPKSTGLSSNKINIVGMDEHDDSYHNNHIQVEGVGKHKVSEYDTSNWEDWNADQVCKYIEYLLIENNYDKKDIDELVNKVLLKMKITGKVLKIFQENEVLLKQFRDKIENHSFGIWVVIANALEQL